MVLRLRSTNAILSPSGDHAGTQREVVRSNKTLRFVPVGTPFTTSTSKHEIPAWTPPELYECDTSAIRGPRGPH